MAEPNTLEWMTEQRDRLKAECDLANTRYDKLVAQDKVEQNTLREQMAQMGKTHAAELAALNKKLADKDAELAAVKIAASNSVEQIKGQMAQETGRLKAIADARRNALAGVMKAVGQVMETVMPLLNE